KAPPRRRSQVLAKWLACLLGLVLIGWILYQAAWVREVLVGWAGHLGEPGVPLLRHALRDGDYKGSEAGATALRGMRGGAVPSLTKSLGSGNPRVRLEAAHALGILGPVAKDALPLLVEALQSEDASLRKQAASALGQFGVPGADAVPALVRVLRQ